MSNFIKLENAQVSIVLSLFNEEKSLDVTIDSVLQQSYDNYEFIIINDASTDKSLEILNNYAVIDKRIKILNNKENLGLTKSLNIGLAASKNNLIARIDAGDLWDKSKLEKQVSYIINNPNCVIVGTNTISINQQTQEVEMVQSPEYDSEIKKHLLVSTPMVHPSILFKKDKVKYYNENFKVAQDYELYSRVLQDGEGYNIQEYLTKIRTHQHKSISLNKWKIQTMASVKIRYKLFRKNKLAFWKYFKLVPDILTLIAPVKAKLWKNRAVDFLKNKMK